MLVSTAKKSSAPPLSQIGSVAGFAADFMVTANEVPDAFCAIPTPVTSPCGAAASPVGSCTVILGTGIASALAEPGTLTAAARARSDCAAAFQLLAPGIGDRAGAAPADANAPVAPLNDTEATTTAVASTPTRFTPPPH